MKSTPPSSAATLNENSTLPPGAPHRSGPTGDAIEMPDGVQVAIIFGNGPKQIM